MSSRRQSRGHPQHHTSGRPPPSSSSNETYTILASLRDKLQSTKITDRRSASKEILEKLQDSNTLRKLEREADLQYDINVSRYAGRGGGSDKNTNNNNEPQVPLPWDRVCVLYRSIMDAALLVSRTLVEGKSESSTTKKRNHANQTGFTKKSTKYTGDDVLFPYKIFLKIDLDQVFDVNDGGYYGSSNISWEEDWKTKPRYGHHLNIHSLVSSSASSSVQKRNQHNDHKNTNGGRYNATYYIPHEYTDRNRGTRLSSKEINGCVNYILNCLNDDDCCSHPGVESSLMHWLVHICSRPEYICNIPPSDELSYVLHELSTRLNRAFVEGHVEERGILPSHKINKRSAISQECLLAVSKCLSSIVYNCTTRLGMGMHLYIRPIIECVGVWAENAWQLQSEGEFASTSHPATEILMHPKSIVSKARNPHSMMVKEGQITATPVRRKLRTEADILALVPYLYSAVTHLLAAHPEQSIPILSDYGHVLLRLARKNYARPTTNLQTRDALTEYVSAHLLVAETSGKLCGLPEGDLGPLVPRIENDASNDDDDQQQEERKQEEGDDSTDISSRNKKRTKDTKRKRGKGATLDAKAIGKLLEMIRNEKVWETLFSSAASGQDAKKKKTRRSLSGRKHGRSGGGGGISLPEGGATWTPLTRRQRRHLELMARLIRISQRLHVSQAEDRGNGTMDSLESLIENAEEMMQSSGIEQGEIDIQPREESSPRQQLSTLSEMDARHVASPSALACSPWIRMVCRHLYKLNPKLGKWTASAAAGGDGTLSQGTIRFTASTQFTQTLQSSESNDMFMGNTDEGTSCERILLESCPILQALTVDEKTIFEEMLGDPAGASTQPGTLTASLTAPTPTMTNSNAELLDTIRPTTTATLQFLCACAEAFPRGECWSSSTRQNWSTILDEGSYPAKTLATILERHGSSPADAAAVVYLLGTTLECHGGSGGDGEIQLWTLVTLLKMTESSAIICSREGLSDAASFGSSSSLTALRTAWQSVWKVLFRYDLRYSSYTSGAFGNNVGELVVQLLTQIVRYQCVDRKCLFTCRPPSTVQSSTDLLQKAPTALSAMEKSPFVHGQQGQLWKLPMFDDASTILSCAPFELIASVVQYAGFSDTVDVNTASSMRMGPAKDRRWFVSLCLRFIELSMNDDVESTARRTYLPFVATCLATLISEGEITSNVSTFELDGLTRFAITEDSEPLGFVYDPDKVEVGGKMGSNSFYKALWEEIITPNDYMKGMYRGLTLRILQGRGAFLNRFSDAQYEREQLQCFMNQSCKSCIDTGISPQRNSLGGSAFDAIKSYLEELMFQLKYDDGNASDEEGGLGLQEKESAVKGGGSDKPLQLPQMTGCLSLLLTVLLSKHSTAEDISKHVCDIFEGTFGSAFDLLVENMPSLKSHPLDLFIVFNHLHGIVRVLTFIAAFGGGKIPHLFGNQAKSLFSMCKKLLKEHRNEMCTSGMSNQAAVSMSRRGFDSDSDEDNFVSSRAQIQPTQPPRSSFSDDSDDGLMDDDDDSENNNRSRSQKAPPIKRRRMGNGSKSKARKDSSRDNASTDTAIDSKGAWACSSFLLVLQPSFQSADIISSHLVWPEDYNNNVGYGIVSKTPDPCSAIVCASLFCQKSVILRRDRLDLQCERDEDQESPLILSIEALLQARRRLLPSSKYFMCSFGLVAAMVKIAEYGESSEPITEDESKIVLEALYPEGVGKENDDYYMLRQMKRHLKFRVSYLTHKLHESTKTFIYAQIGNLRKEFESVYGSKFILPSFCHIDENVRSLACDVLGAALYVFPEQGALVADVLKQALPKLDNKNKFDKWVDKNMTDPRLIDDRKDLEDRTLNDIEISIEYHTIECIGLIAGYAKESALAKDMIWKLIDLASKRPLLLLPCYRSCKQAAFIREYKSLSGMFDDMMPHLLVRWLESQRSLRDFPLLLMSPFALDRACRFLPLDIMSMLLSEGGWSDEFFNLDSESESQTLNERVLTSFVESVSKFLIPNILLASSETPANDIDNDCIDASKYLTECVIILKDVDSDNNKAHMLIDHISDLYGYVAVLAENGDATLECENAFKLLKRCVSSGVIERQGAKGAFLVLRHILLLHLRGIAVVGLDGIELTSSSFIDGMKYVAKQLKTSSSKKHVSFLEQLGSSMTESIVLVKYWLSSSQTSRQREEAWGTFSLLCGILADNIKSGKVGSGELGFALNSFIAVLLDPQNTQICPIVLESLNMVLSSLFANTAKETLVEGSISVLHKLSLTLLQTHQRAYEKLYTSCDSALCRLEYEQKSSQGLLSGFEGTQKTWDSLGEAPWTDTSLNRDAILKHLVASKASLEERVSSDIMLGAYECLEIIATSGKMQLEDILGAEDIVLQCSHKESVFKSVNEKYSMLTFFNSIQQNSTKNSDETNLDVECEHFIRIMKEHPISTVSDEFDSGASSSSHAVLARLLALRRLERVLLEQQRTATTIGKIHEDVYHFLLSICHSREPETSRVISSRCLGEMKLDNLTTRHEQDIHNLNGMDETLNDPILSIKRSILTLLGQYLLSECADTSLVAMKTAKALLVTPTGKEVWQSLDGDNDVKSLLRPFNAHDDGKLRKEAVKVSKSCLERLKSAGGVTSSENSNSWCWQDELWTCLGSEESSCDLWIRNITSSIISCCFGKESKVEKGDQEFFRICQGLCAKEASFAASIFPALIFHLLDSEARDACREDSGVPDIIMSNTAIGSPTSGMNKVISHCFSRIIGSNVQVAPQVITVVLNTLELLRSITEHRFLTSTDHRKNTSHIADAFTNSASLSKKSVSKKRKSRDNSVSDAANIIDSIVENSPKWRGFPYGVVLRVSGLDVAKACVKVKRYYSALYYAEMSMNNLIGTGAFFEDLADSQLKHSESAVLDISGFGVLSTEEGQADDKVLEKALVAKDIIASCLSELHSQDELQGVLSQGSALNLKRNITSLTTLEGCRRDKPLSMLLDIDNELQTSSAAISESVSAHTHASLGLSTVASCLEELGLNHVKHNYLAGVENHLGRDNRSGRHYLREKWFEDSLNKTLQWDDTLLPRMNMTDDGSLLTQQHVMPQNLSSEATVQGAPPPSSQPMATFYESVSESLLSFARNDATGGLGHVLQARKSVLADMEYLAGSEAQSTGMVNHLTKLNSLGRLELVAKTLEGKSDLSFLLNRWGFSREGSAETLESILLNDDVNFDVKDQVVDIEGELFRSIRTGLSVEELSLKLLTNKFSSSHKGIAMALSSHIYKSCSIYRELGHPDAAKISLSSLRSLVQVFQSAGVADHSSGKLPLMLRLEDAKIMKSQDDLDGAIMHCKMIANHLTNASDSSVDIERDQICAESLLLGGLWMRENNVDSSEIILSSYLEAAAGLAMKVQKKEPSTANIHRASMSSFKLGEFSATLYNSVDARTSSDGWKRRIIAALERKKELKVIEAQMAKLTRNKEAHHDALILHSTLSKEVLMDDRELQSVENSIQRYLHLAVESYCNALKLCPTSVTDVSKYVFQLVSLWFKNCQQKETKDIVNHLLKSNLSQIPSYRLVPLTYQLFSRIDEVQDDDSNGGFQNTLRDIVLKICSEHPYHGIVQILALSNGQRIGGGVNGRHADAYLENIGTTKVDAVNKIIKELRKQAPAYVSALIDSYQTLMISYMNLAEFVTKSIEKNLKNHPFKKHKLDLDSCLSGGGRRCKKNVTGSSENMPAIITQPPPIRPDAQYGNGTEDPIGTERVVSFEPTFDLTPTGIHRPKIIKCIGSKGTRFKQLVKGEDDMRQDAIMQQVFGTVNDLLRHERNDFMKKSLGSSVGSKRRLRLITYGITPLSPTSGVLEWVENTMCFGDYLTDKSRKLGAKSKYYPGEWGLSDIRDFYKAQDTPETKRLAFDKICDNSSPAFRFFFLEYFKSSMETWHTARTLYTRSCAVNSIVGHILGIGDRHTSNILVHTKTGEVVHIDFGIVFEQGKTLTTPELVPFRLTRDIVDGMGPSGTDGVFSKSAEATMGVLRNNADTLLTILSAVVSDPLYKWSLSPMKAKQHQRKDDEDEDGNGSTTIVSMPNAWMASTSDDRNDTADRAIAKIHEKLQGYEDGISGEHKTVAGQVKLLINEARDPDNLCMMFCGWAPWM